MGVKREWNGRTSSFLEVWKSFILILSSHRSPRYYRDTNTIRSRRSNVTGYPFHSLSCRSRFTSVSLKVRYYKDPWNYQSWRKCQRSREQPIRIRLLWLLASLVASLGLFVMRYLIISNKEMIKKER
jgi:hypothetical protein